MIGAYDNRFSKKVKRKALFLSLSFAGSRNDAFVKSQDLAFPVIPAKAGIQSFQ